MNHHQLQNDSRKKVVLLLMMLLCAKWSFSQGIGVSSGEQDRTSFDKGWRFKLYEYGTDDTSLGHEKLLVNDLGWQKIDIPHDWGIEGAFREDLPNRTGMRPFSGIGWYRKRFTLPQSDEGKRIFIDFDGAMSQAQVWLNGQYLGQRPYGYTSFRLELTPHIRIGERNAIAVRLNNPPDSSRWYPGGGIYRHVWLVKTHPVHVGHWGTFVTTPKVSSDEATVAIQTTIDNQDTEAAHVSVRHEISLLDAPDEVVSRKEVSSLNIASGKSAQADASVILKKPDLWNVSNPALYLLTTTVLIDQKPVDVYRTPFGIRSIVTDPVKGFLLNGRRIQLNGVCLHSDDMGPLGTAVHRRAIERQLEILKDMGCNAIRCSHNPPSPDFLELCDVKGFLVVNEAFDCWVAKKTKNDYSRFFNEWYEKDIISCVHRDRNHPCVIMWSCGNEVSEGWVPDGVDVSQELVDIFHREDPTRPVTICCNFYRALLKGFFGAADVYGLNYTTGYYKKVQDFSRKIPMFSSETASCFSSRGEYFFPVSPKTSGGAVYYQVSSYDLYAPGYGESPDSVFAKLDKSPFVMGEFVWTGFDYLGEPAPYDRERMTPIMYRSQTQKRNTKETIKKMGSESPARSSYFGILDLCGFKKDRFYLYQSRWRPDYPMAHILPHWNWPERVGEVTPVHVYTSGDEAELFLNGQSLGRKKKEKFQYRLVWNDALYEPGKLKVVAYKNGHQWAESTQRTTGPAESLVLESDRKTIDADGRDLSYITIKVIDKDGLVVPRSDAPLSFSIEGPGQIVATGNGNAIDPTSFQSTQRKTYNGLCLAVVRSLDNKAGKICVRVQSETLQASEVYIESRL